jgi:hypothetical protein
LCARDSLPTRQFDFDPVCKNIIHDANAATITTGQPTGSSPTKACLIQNSNTERTPQRSSVRQAALRLRTVVRHFSIRQATRRFFVETDCSEARCRNACLQARCVVRYA